VLDRLEAAGLVRRVRDTQDRRKVIVEVTEKVARQGAPVYGPLVADAAEAHAVFDADELEVITRFIRIERDLLAKHTDRVARMESRDPSA
jgi:DNA-binding MarR family transcriptional regulator